MRKTIQKVKRALSITLAAAIAVAGLAVSPAETVKADEIDLDSGVYNAYLGLQTPNWTYRNVWNDSLGVGSEYWGQFIYGNETGETYGVVTDAEVAGNGTYTVSITDFGTIFEDDFAAAGQDYFNLLFISTDIPLSDSISITDVTLKIDGKTIETYDEAFLDPDETEYVKILIQNIWNDDVAEISYYSAPTESLEMSFTISGFNYDNEAAMAEEEETTAADTESSDDSTTADDSTTMDDADDADAADNADSDTESGGLSTGAIVVIVIVVVAVIVIIIYMLTRKKKEA